MPGQGWQCSQAVLNLAMCSSGYIKKHSKLIKAPSFFESLGSLLVNIPVCLFDKAIGLLVKIPLMSSWTPLRYMVLKSHGTPRIHSKDAWKSPPIHQYMNIMEISGFHHGFIWHDSDSHQAEPAMFVTGLSLYWLNQQFLTEKPARIDEWSMGNSNRHGRNHGIAD